MKASRSSESTEFGQLIILKFITKNFLVKTLVTRAYQICSNYHVLHTEFKFLRKLLFMNGFPVKFIDSYIGKQLTKLLHPTIPVITVNKKIVYFPIQFLGPQSFAFRNKLTNLLRDFYPQVTLRVIFRSDNTIQRFFRYKDRIPDALQSSIVYLYECSRCNATYIGQSKRHLRTKIAEHQGRSFRTNQHLSKP